jgi:hypothetical protein
MMGTSIVQDLEKQIGQIKQRIKDIKNQEYMDSLPPVFCPYCKAKMIPQSDYFNDDDYVTYSTCSKCGSQTPHYFGSHFYEKHPTGLVERSVSGMKFFSDWKVK